MKENKELTKKEAYSISLTRRVKATFIKDFGAFKKGAETLVSLPIAIKWVNSGAVQLTDEIEKTANEFKMQELIKSKSKKESV